MHSQLEKLTSEFLGVEDAFLCGAGFATNALNLPAILSHKCLVLSDEKNHASLILGLRTSKASILKYVHNGKRTTSLQKLCRLKVVPKFTSVSDFDDLESKIIENLKKNKASGGKLFSKLFVVTEGIYSMDGTILNLSRILELKKKYKVPKNADI